MKISSNLYGRMDGSKILCFPWFPENSLLCVKMKNLSVSKAEQLITFVRNFRRTAVYRKETNTLITFGWEIQNFDEVLILKNNVVGYFSLQDLINITHDKTLTPVTYLC